MKYLVLVFVALILLNTVNLSFAAKENPVYAAKPHFPESIKIGEKTAFSVKVSNTAGTWVSSIAPVIDVNPKSATSFVHITANPSVTVLPDGYSDIVHATIYVDTGIPVDRIFVSVSFTAKNSRLEQIPLVNHENNASIRIEKETPLTDSMFDLENKKPSCTGSDIPLYGCHETMTVKINSPLQQLKSGIKAKDVVCKKEPVYYELAMKKSNGQPIYIKGTNMKALTLRGYIPEYNGVLGGQILIPNCNIDDSLNLPLTKVDTLGLNHSRLVFFVKSGTESHICIKYKSNLNNTGMHSIIHELGGRFLVLSNNTRSNIKVNPNPDSVSMILGSETVVDYAIYVQPEKDGVYWLNVSQMCDQIPVVIWSSVPKVSPNDIPVIVGTHGCPALYLDAKIVGYGGGTIEYRSAKPLSGR